MEITWYGLSCFRVREGNTTVVCDPYDKAIGLNLPKIRADIVTVSHDVPGHSAADKLQGEPKILRGPGEYEVKNVFVSGMANWHRKHKGDEPERTIAYFMEFGDLTVGHLGDIGEVPKQSEIEELNLADVDILLVPVGGGATLDSARAIEVIGMLEPRIVIPMHFKHEGLDSLLANNLDPVEKFLKEFGVPAPEAVETLKVSKSSLPDETQIALLKVVQ